MKPKTTEEPQDRLFQNRLANMINMDHELVKLGNKTSITSTHKGNFIIGAQTYGGCHNCDKGYRGKARHKEIPCAIHIPGMKGKSTVTLRKKLKRRNAIEPIIGHLKSDYEMDRNYPKGRNGAEINALMASCAYNLKKTQNHLRVFVQIYLKAENPTFLGSNVGFLSWCLKF